MGYVEDEAMARELMRQRLLHGGLDPAQVKATQDYMDQFLAQTRPRGVTQSATEALKPYINAVGRSPSVASYTPPSDDSLGKALANMFTGSANVGRAAQVQVAKEQADREAAKKGGGAAAPSTAPPGPPPVPPASLFPGLRAGVDASQVPPGAPAAEAYYAQHESIPGVRGRVGPTVGPEGPMPSPQAAAPAPGSSSTLASQRAGYKAFFDANPDAKERMAALTLAEEGDNPKNPAAASDDRTSLVESALNRWTTQNVDPGSVSRLLANDPRSYYQPLRPGGTFERNLAAIRSNPQLRAKVYADIDRATGGSNVSNYATDNGSAGVGRRAQVEQSVARMGNNGETFSRKDVRPDIHGAQHVANIKEWYNNTVAAQADEPGAPTETKTASSGDTPVATRPMSPAKLPEDWKPGETEAKAPPATDFDKQLAPVPYTGEFKSEAAPEAAPAPQQLTREGLYAYGQKQLADRAGAPQTNFDAANKSLNMTPQEQALYQRHLTNFYGTGGVDNSDGSRSSLRQATVQVGDKVYSIPTVRNGQILEGPDAIKAAEAEGWDKFPSYANHDQAEARYGQMHDFMDKDAQAYFAQRQGQPQIQMTPQIGKAAVEVTAPPKDTGGERIAPVTPPADALPVRPAEPAITPPPATSPQTQYVPGGTLPQGNAPQQLADAAQGNSVALLSLSPTQPVDQLSTPLTQSIGAGSMSPIPWQDVQGWGWSPSSADMGGMNMGGGGGGKFGGAGGFMGGGD